MNQTPIDKDILRLSGEAVKNKFDLISGAHWRVVPGPSGGAMASSRRPVGSSGGAALPSFI